MTASISIPFTGYLGILELHQWMVTPKTNDISKLFSKFRKTGIDPVDGTVFGGQVYLNNEGGKSFAGIQGINTTTPHKDFVTRAPTKLEHKEAVDHT